MYANQFIVDKDSFSQWVMERAIESVELRKALEQILELCLKTARGLRVVLEEGARRKPATPDEGVVRKSGPAPVEDGNR